jgi:hypothetical protein
MSALAIGMVCLLALVALVLSTRRQPKRTYVIVKGAEGFGDRLQCLLQAVRYAKRTSRTLVVDWRDEHWCHDGRSGFSDYFGLIGVRSAEVSELSVALSDGPSTLSSDKWTSRAVGEPTSVAELYRHDPFSDDPSDATCVVHPGVKYRAWWCSDAPHVRARPWLAARVRQVFDGIKGAYTAVHLRGGDRLARTGQSRESYVAALRAQVAPGESVILVSDDAGLVADYTAQCVAEKWPIPRVSGLTPPAECINGNAGAHLTSVLPCPWLTKRELNANAVCDFVVLSHADRVVADGASLFSQMALCLPYPAFGIRTRK